MWKRIPRIIAETAKSHPGIRAPALGLPTVLRIMEEHNGGLEIDSEEGQGTRVTLWLQRHQEALEPLKA